MKSDIGWMWFWRVGPFSFGLDLSTWGLGLLVALRYPRGFSLHAGPFFLTLEGADFERWLGDIGEWVEDLVTAQLNRLDARVDTLSLRRRKRKLEKQLEREHDLDSM